MRDILLPTCEIVTTYYVTPDFPHNIFKVFININTALSSVQSEEIS